MRLLFLKDKQKELIKKEKEKLNLSWNEFAKFLGIKYGKLHAYYYDNVLLPEKIYNKFSVKEKFRNLIIEKRNENWGKSKGGKLSRGKTKAIMLPQNSKELAEFYGIMLGDGNLTKIQSYKIGTYEIRIVGDSRYDRFYLENYVKPLIEKLFTIKVRISKRKNQNTLVLAANGKKLVEFLESRGFKPGDKIKNQLTIPNWIKRDKKLLKACIRGLYDTDGSVYQLTNQNSYQICLVNYNNTLLNEVRNNLLNLGIGVSKITKGRDILITKKSELRKFLKEIGFSNSKHLEKIKRWKI